MRLDTVHQLHTQIYTQLRSAGIEITYPQRDLHIRTFPMQALQSLAARNGGLKKAGEESGDAYNPLAARR